MTHPTLTVGGAILGGLLFLALFAVCAMAGKKSTVDQLQIPAPPDPSLSPEPAPCLGYVPTQLPVRREWLPMSPDSRAAETDQLRALWAASPDEPANQQRANPEPHEPA